jgi:hypothetical protein
MKTQLAQSAGTRAGFAKITPTTLGESKAAASVVELVRLVQPAIHLSSRTRQRCPKAAAHSFVGNQLGPDIDRITRSGIDPAFKILEPQVATESKMRGRNKAALALVLPRRDRFVASRHTEPSSCLTPGRI